MNLMSAPRITYKTLVDTAESAKKFLYDAAKAAVGYFRGRRVVESPESIIRLNGSDINSKGNNIYNDPDTSSLTDYEYEDYPIIDGAINVAEISVGVDKEPSSSFTSSNSDNFVSAENNGLDLSLLDRLLYDESPSERDIESMESELRMRIRVLQHHAGQLRATPRQDELEKCVELITCGENAIKSLKNSSSIGKSLSDAEGIANDMLYFARSLDALF